MAKTILYLDGKYNVYNSISEQPVFSRGVDALEVHEYYMQMHAMEIREQISRAKQCCDLEGTISCNRAGKNESEMTTEAFIDRFLK